MISIKTLNKALIIYDFIRLLCPTTYKHLDSENRALMRRYKQSANNNEGKISRVVYRLAALNNDMQSVKILKHYRFLFDRGLLVVAASYSNLTVLNYCLRNDLVYAPFIVFECAVKYAQFEAIKLMISKGFGCNINSIIQAAKINDIGILDFLIKYNPNFKHYDDISVAVYVSARAGCAESVIIFYNLKK